MCQHGAVISSLKSQRKGALGDRCRGFAALVATPMRSPRVKKMYVPKRRAWFTPKRACLIISFFMSFLMLFTKLCFLASFSLYSICLQDSFYSILFCSILFYQSLIVDDFSLETILVGCSFRTKYEQNLTQNVTHYILFSVYPNGISSWIFILLFRLFPIKYLP